MIAAEGPGLDAFSYHFYGGASKRCVSPGGTPQATVEAALTPAWLNRTNHEADFYIGLRDRLTPGIPVWLTETAETACGGDPWASTFLDTFRYLNQLGSLAKKNVQVVAHNTLAASDYGLIDETTLIPRPNYWAALLWRQLMGTTVLEAGPQLDPSLYIYAHCQREHPGSVALLVINADKSAPKSLSIATSAQGFTMSSSDLLTPIVQLNGVTMQLGSGDTLPVLTGKSISPGIVRFAPATITFLAVQSSNPACIK